MSTHGIQRDPCCVFPADGKTVTKDLFELKPVADGVYAAIAAPQYKVNSNAAVILTNDGVVVVDSHSKPSAARALYQEIRGLTKNPVHKLINTHFHWDHWQGNEVYAEASTNLEIIVSERTRQNLTDTEAGVGGIPHIERQLAALPQEIEQLKDQIMRATNPEQKANLETNLQALVPLNVQTRVREQFFWTPRLERVMLLRTQVHSYRQGETMTLTHIRCPYCNGKNVEEQSTYTIKCGAPRTMYYCASCERSFSETSRTPIAHLNTPIALVVQVLTALTEGVGINAATRLYGVSKNSLYRWQERLSGLQKRCCCLL